MSTNELAAGLRPGTDLVQVLRACQAASPADASNLLRLAYAAVAEELAMTAAVFGELPPPGQFEAMLLCGALESAALTLLPRGASFMLSRGGDRRHLGSVFMAECGEHTVEGNTLALALMAATLSAWRDLLHAPTARPDLLN